MKTQRSVAEPPPAPGCARAERPAPALLLACGNGLRQDDGVGLVIAAAAEQCFPASRLRIVAAHQFTPEMAADLTFVRLVIFVDASLADEPGAIRVVPVAARTDQPETHRLDPPALLALAESLCGHAPDRAFALTIGARSMGYGDRLSGPLRQAVPRALRLVANLVEAFAAAR